MKNIFILKVIIEIIYKISKNPIKGKLLNVQNNNKINEWMYKYILLKLKNHDKKKEKS